jgi:hypothetical protein
VVGVASLAVSSSGAGGDEGDGRSKAPPEESEGDDSRFALHTVGDERYLVGTEDYVEPDSVSKETTRTGSYHVKFEVTGGSVKALGCHGSARK